MKIIDQNVKETFSEYPPFFRKKLLELRKIIFEVAKKNPVIGELEESLKWGQPSYSPKKPKVGTSVRIHWLKSKPEQYGIYFHCQTNLIQQFRKKFPQTFHYQGTRAIIFNKEDLISETEMSLCIEMALTYHLYKKRKS